MKPKLIKKSQCTGCGACAAVCAHQAITMNYDRNGYLMPKINTDKCVNCHLCESRCPILNISKLEFHSAKEIRNFTAWSNNDDVCFHSSSGGIFSQLALNMIHEEEGTVAGAHLTCHNTVHHITITQGEELPLIAGTKYIQSNASTVYSKIKKTLTSGKKVLFCGTPCQVAGLYAVLGFKHYDNLLTTELICHGVGSQVAAEISTAYYGADYLVSNRDKEDGWVRENLKRVSPKSTYSKNGELLRTTFGKDIFFTFFSNTHCMSCTNCKFAQINRVADLSLGDQWGLYKSVPKRAQLGASLVVVNTPKGMQAIQSPNITIIENSNNTLNAYPLFCQAVSPSTTLASWLWFFRKLPNKWAVNFISLDYKHNPLVIPIKIIWRFAARKQLKKILKTIQKTKEKEGWA